MPRISSFFGIAISMYWNEASHQIPHFHAAYGDEEASVAFDGTILEGALPARSARLVREWALLHQVELAHNWEMARTRQPLARSIPWPSILDMATKRPPWIIKGVAAIGDHKLRLLFEDGTVGDVSFEDDPWDGVFAPLRDPARFGNVTVIHGTLFWPDEGLDWAPEPLYEAARANALIAT